ncbi:MAG: hypothetical protein Q7K37_01745 [Dehalococcoidia bacterium]|nr:hypothetical protein [Dehalococcoidia bacterium]
MTVSPAILLLSLAIGVPLMLLALGVLYHGYLLSQQTQRDPLEAHVESLATESTEALLTSLQRSVDQLQGQMARQRDSLAGLLSDQRAAMTFVTAAPTPRADDRPMAAGEHVSAATPAISSTSDLRSRVLALTEDGLSDRAIARELNVGLEEVRIARLRGGRA